ECDSASETLERIDAFAHSNVSTWLVAHRETQLLLDRARADIQQILSLAPSRITLHPVLRQRQITLRFRGLSFARWEESRTLFGYPEIHKELTPASQHTLKELLCELEIRRHPLAPDVTHTPFRRQAERWLETLVREDVSRVDAALDSRFAYAQVLAETGG